MRYLSQGHPRYDKLTLVLLSLFDRKKMFLAQNLLLNQITISALVFFEPRSIVLPVDIDDIVNINIDELKLLIEVCFLKPNYLIAKLLFVCQPQWEPIQ